MIVIFYKKLNNNLNVVKTPFALAKTQEDAILFCKHNILFTCEAVSVDAKQRQLPYIIINPDQSTYHFQWP